MSQIDLSKLIFHSSFSGFGNSGSSSGSYTVPSFSIGTSPNVASYTNSVPLTIGNSLSQVEVSFGKTGTNPINDPNTYIFKGFLGNFYEPVVANLDYEWTNNVIAAYFEIDVMTSYTTNTLVFTTIIYNLSGSTETFPGLIVNYKYSTYSTPF